MCTIYSSQSKNWRLLKTPPKPGPWNMAIDEAILEAVGQEIVPPTLRLYSWSPPCLSIGYAQRHNDVDLTGLQNEGWDLVRRPTGGRAILHADELTYSIITSNNEPLTSGSVLESYQLLAQGLLKALQLLNVTADSKEKYSSDIGQNAKGPVCFEVPSNWEITINGRKIIGSAQTRRKYGVLQHGTLPLAGDLTRIIRVLNFSGGITKKEAAHRLLKRATTMYSALDRDISWNEAALAMQKGFEEILNIKFATTKITEEEKNRAAYLVKEKYANPIWTLRV